MLRRNVCRWRVGIFPLHLDPPTFEHRAICQRVMEQRGLSKLILLPNTRFAVPIAQSIHLAAMATLATDDLKSVEVDLSCLETPDPTLPRVRQLLQAFPDAELIHWLPDIHHMPQYSCYRDIAAGTRKCTLLRPEQFGVGASSSNPAVAAAAGGSAARADAFPDSEIISVVKTTGANVRRRLYDDVQGASACLPPSVLRYVDNHGLYRDPRRARSQDLVRVDGDSRMPTAFSPRVTFQGRMPRLQLLYDPSNVLAVELARQMCAFSVREGEVPDLIVPIGGDGFLMQTVRAHWQRFIPFFGVNAGTVGYLLNDASTLEELFTARLKLHQLPMLYVKAEHDEFDEKGMPIVKTQEALAFNDAWVERATGQTALIDVKVNGEVRIKRVRGDGVLVSTPAGSTAYARALGASPLPVGSPIMQLVGSNCVFPMRWKPVHLHQDVIVELENCDNQKRPILGFVDSVNLGRVSRMTIRSSRVAGVQLAFCESCDLQSKLYKLQFPSSS